MSAFTDLNRWYRRMIVGTTLAFVLYFGHAIGFDLLGYDGVVRELELLVWLSVFSSAGSLYCWYRGRTVDDE